MSGEGRELERAKALLGRAAAVERQGLAGLADVALLELLAEHRRAVGRLAAPSTPMAVRTVLNAAVIKTHGLLHQRPRRSRAALAVSLRRVGRALGLSAVVLLASSGLAFTAVLGDPILAPSLVPRELLQQIGVTHWGERGSGAANLGMTLFYWGNNLRAAFLALGLGVLAGLPALLVVAFNGTLLGAVAAVSVQRGAGHRLLAWIAPHGVPELLGVLLCAAIGWELGWSWIRPGWRRRRDALAEAGRILSPMLLVAAVLVACAAPLEGFVAPRELPPWLDLAIASAWVVGLTAAALACLRREAA